eukprot:GEZU01040587.1.p1 GENE.GEZU01040587.1~~GEZU01040587.1.p1  ORF type:complete len:509 (-),score=114.87 GEZU01040587.1:129-1430(-)
MTSRLPGSGYHTLLRRRYNNSLGKALTTVFPEYDWLPWRFSSSAAPAAETQWLLESGFWDDLRNQRRFFDWAARQLNVAKPDDWYNVSGKDVAELGGGGGFLYTYYGGSLYKALCAVYPEHGEWLPWRFRVVPSGFWMDKANQRRFLEWAAKQLQVRSPDDWYSKVSHEDICRLGGARLLRGYYNDSLPRALVAIFPEVEWQPWRFGSSWASSSSSSSLLMMMNSVDSPFANGDETMLRRYIDYLAKEFDIQQLDEWYRVSHEQIRALGGYATLVEHGGLCAVLKKLYPEHHWDEERFARAKGKKASQRWLRVSAQRLFPDEEIFEDYVHPALSAFQGSNTSMTLDICIPSLRLALEYQGQQHYRELHVFGGASMSSSTKTQSQRDHEKQSACKDAGITLITVPYWWDRSIESLAAAIYSARPDLDPTTTRQI